MRRHRQHATGLSLTDTMIAMAVIGIIMVIASPNFISQIPKHRLNGAAKQVAWDLMAARMQAIRQKHTVRVTFPSNQVYTIWTDLNGNDTVDPGEEQSKNIQSIYRGITLNATNNPVFSSTGTVTNIPVITINNGNGTRTITITNVGVVQIN